jgi:hypothetical protein
MVDVVETARIKTLFGMLISCGMHINGKRRVDIAIHTAFVPNQS